MEIKPLKHSVRAEPHTPQYRMHKYFARRPYNVFRRLIEHYTRKGDLVLDCFCGGGVTVFEAAALGRVPIGVDLNPLAAFVSRMQMFSGDVEELNALCRRFLLAEEKKYGDWYHVTFEDDQGTALWTEWVYTAKCPLCGSEMLLSEEHKISNGVYRCPCPDCPAHENGIKRVLCVPLGSRIRRVSYRSEVTGAVRVRPAGEENFSVLKKRDFQKILDALPCRPEFPIPEDWDRRYEDKLPEKGVRSFSDFFTLGNYTLNCLIFNDILTLREHMDPALNEYLYFLFSSSLRYTNKMTRVTDNWEGGKPTAMDKHAFWLPNQYVETNILEILRQRAGAILKGCAYAASVLPRGIAQKDSFEELKAAGGYQILAQSACSLPLPDASIDAVITDPPYGSNVQYAELSTIWNAWYALYQGLDRWVYKEQEAVASRKHNYQGAKTVVQYEDLLFGVFAECARVLKPEGYLVFTFQNKNLKVWAAMLRAVARAGFYLPEDGILFQDYIRSYKNTAHLRFSGNIQGDFIYSFKKGAPPNRGTSAGFLGGITALVEEAVDATIKTLFGRGREDGAYTTPELYQKLLANLTGRLMAYILECRSAGKEMEDISAFSNDYLENRLKKALSYEEGVWRLGKEVFHERAAQNAETL